MPAAAHLVWQSALHLLGLGRECGLRRVDGDRPGNLRADSVGDPLRAGVLDMTDQEVGIHSWDDFVGAVLSRSPTGTAYSLDPSFVGATPSERYSNRLTRLKSMCGCSSGSVGLMIAGAERASAGVLGNPALGGLPAFSWPSTIWVVLLGALLGKVVGLAVKWVLVAKLAWEVRSASLGLGDIEAALRV